MNSEKLKSLAAQGSRAFLSAVPRVALGGLKGGLGGFLLMGALGAALSVGSGLLWRGNAALPGWLTASLFVTPLVLGLAGLFIGAVRGLLAALAVQVVEKKLLAYLYAQVKPAVVAAVRKSSGADPSQLAAEVHTQLGKTLEEAPAEKPASLGDRLAHFVTMNSRRVLAMSVVAHVARAKNGAEAKEELEKLGVAKLEAIVVGSLEDLFAVKLTLIAGGALVVAFMPQAIWWLTR